MYDLSSTSHIERPVPAFLIIEIATFLPTREYSDQFLTYLINKLATNAPCVFDVMAERKELESPADHSSTLQDSDLPKVRSHVPYRVWLIQGLVFLERAASYGASQPYRVSPNVTVDRLCDIRLT